MPPSTPIRRSLYLVACLAPVWAVVAFATDGFTLALGGLRIKATEPIRPLMIGALAAAFYLRKYGRADIDHDGRWLLNQLKRAALVAVPILVLMACAIGIHYGSFTAGGSDSYGYVSQASLWLKGSLRIEQPWVQQFSSPIREWMFAPLGYRPISTDGTIVPTYASGLPMVMAIFQAVFGANGPFLVVPVVGALAVWMTYVLGREATGSRAVGTLAALLLLSSPTFLAHLMLPMTDVVVAAGWTLVCLLALGAERPPSRETSADHPSLGGGGKLRPTGTPRAPRALLAGLAAGATLMVRPNLVLLAMVPLVTWRSRPAAVVRFAIGLAPAVAAIGAINWYLYGSPFTSGYGGLGDLYGWSSAWPNLTHYSLWLVQTQTPLVALAVVPMIARGALRPDTQTKVRLCLGSLMVLTLVSYIFYNPFNLWMYLRFLLPTYPALFVLMAAGIRFVCAKMPVPVRALAAMLMCALCVASSYQFSRDWHLFTSKDFEQRHIKAARYVEQLTPETAVIICVQHSGSVRYYAHRITLRYDSIYEHRLDTTLRELAAKGYRPYIVVDDWEEVEFRKRFAAKNRAGALDWKPVVRVLTSPEVRIFDPEGRFE